ncbi:MAG: HAD family phosphatase [Melioribacteraceae bacterium]|nr:HAD family phosphatase [Melioribacteraceae bacterium]
MIEISSDIKALLFDCDGTLADTMPIHLNAWDESFKLVNRICPIDFFDSMKGAPAEKIIKIYNEKFDDDLHPEKFAKSKDNLIIEKLKNAKPIKPVADLAFQYKNILPVAVVSGGLKRNVLLTLEALGMEDHFDAIITSDDGLAPKPNPDMFLEAAKRLNVSPENCLVFEDADLGIEAAVNANMKFIDVREFI